MIVPTQRPELCASCMRGVHGACSYQNFYTGRGSCLDQQAHWDGGVIKERRALLQHITVAAERLPEARVVLAGVAVHIQHLIEHGEIRS